MAKYALMTASVEGTRVNAALLDGVIAKLVAMYLDRNHRQVLMQSNFENSLYTVIVFTSAYHKVSTPKALRNILKSLVSLDKADPQFLVDYATGGPLLVSPVEEFIDAIIPEYNEIVMAEDLEQI